MEPSHSIYVPTQAIGYQGIASRTSLHSHMASFTTSFLIFLLIAACLVQPFKCRVLDDEEVGFAKRGSLLSENDVSASPEGYGGMLNHLLLAKKSFAKSNYPAKN